MDPFRCSVKDRCSLLSLTSKTKDCDTSTRTGWRGITKTKYSINLCLALSVHESVLGLRNSNGLKGRFLSRTLFLNELLPNKPSTEVPRSHSLTIPLVDRDKRHLTSQRIIHSKRYDFSLFSVRLTLLNQWCPLPFDLGLFLPFGQVPPGLLNQTRVACGFLTDGLPTFTRRK